MLFYTWHFSLSIVFEIHQNSHSLVALSLSLWYNSLFCEYPSLFIHSVIHRCLDFFFSSFGLLQIMLLEAFLYMFLVHIYIHFCWAYTLEWDIWVIGYAYVPLATCENQLLHIHRWPFKKKLYCVLLLSFCLCCAFGFKKYYMEYHEATI